MVHLALWHTHHLIASTIQTPTEINLLHVRKESAIQSPYFIVCLLSYKQSGSCGPENLYWLIILTSILLHLAQDSSSTIWKTIFIDKSACSSGMLKLRFIIIGQYLRLTGCYLRMGIHIFRQNCMPILRHLHIRIQQHNILCIHLCDGLVIPFGKSIVLIQLNQRHLWILSL